ncbi:hypothetical protein PGIGA_G00209780 [Pangasianodon gigas]|uniref:Uncharacterized protein n=1 Tax=Pangasianodon gigas TaxID=30993 RepID=A0ACC5WG28_PANGG|nr:hypothetical protein [Pangasianodon gigas]
MWQYLRLVCDRNEKTHGRDAHGECRARARSRAVSARDDLSGGFRVISISIIIIIIFIIISTSTRMIILPGTKPKK